MPDWTLGEMMSDLTHRLGRRVDIPRSVVSRYVNQAYSDVANIARPFQRENVAVSSTTSGENRYELPPDFLEVVNLSWLTDINSARTLRPTTLERIDAKGFTPVGTPQEYAIYANWVELWPSPNSAYSLQIRYRSLTTDLSLTTDIPAVSREWRFPIVLKAESYLHKWLGNEQEAAAASSAYALHVAQLDSDPAKRQRDKPGMKVRVIW